MGKAFFAFHGVNLEKSGKQLTMAFLMQVSTYFVEAFNHDKDNVTLKAMPGLTASHLEPNEFEKMRVSHAFQLFGNHVLRGLRYCKSLIESSYGKGSIDATEAFFKNCG